MSTDRIEKSTILHAPLERVWLALTDSSQFGEWFGMKVDGPFEPGRRVPAVIVPTIVDPVVAEAQKPYEGMKFDIHVESIQPSRLFSFRWTSYVPEKDDDSPPTLTLVVFTLEEQPGVGVRLTVTESGFDQVPLKYRAKAFSDNEQGWVGQMKLIEGYLARNP